MIIKLQAPIPKPSPRNINSNIKKMKKLIFYAIVILTIYSCKPDDSDENSNKNYLKSYYSDAGIIINHFYEYEDGFLTKRNQSNDISTYKYDNNSRLISKTAGGLTYSYEYDDQNRLIKETKNGTNDYISLNYLTNKIVVTDYSSYNDTNLVYELFIDNLGRVFKRIVLTPTNYNGYYIEEYTYDVNGNIINLIFSSSSNNNPDLSISYQFDNKINPFYIANKNLYKSIYYLTFGNNAFRSDLNPNNIIRNENSTYIQTINYIYNVDNLPTKSIISTNPNGSSEQYITTALYEYY